MASVTIRRLGDTKMERLRVRASRHGRSMVEEVRQILMVALSGTASGERNIAESIRRRFAAVGGIELPTVPSELTRDPPDFQ
jgi:plasmid stability protein